eukprot:PhF_6_TR2255/c0_g1_i1/m.3863
MHIASSLANSFREIYRKGSETLFRSNSNSANVTPVTNVPLDVPSNSSMTSASGPQQQQEHHHHHHPHATIVEPPTTTSSSSPKTALKVPFVPPSVKVGGGQDPLEAPAGLYGSPGASQRRRSVAVFVEAKSALDDPDSELPIHRCSVETALFTVTPAHHRQLRRMSVSPELGLPVPPQRMMHCHSSPQMTPNQSTLLVRKRSASSKNLKEVLQPPTQPPKHITPPPTATATDSVADSSVSERCVSEYDEDLGSKKSSKGNMFALEGDHEHVEADDDEGYESSSDTDAEAKNGEAFGRKFLMVTQHEETVEDEIERLKSTHGTDGRFDGMHLKEFPAEILVDDFVYLTSLNVSENELIAVPCEIGMFVNLTLLNLSSNNISELPRELSKLVHLETLLLDHNMLTCIPETFSALQNLKKVGLEWNSLEFFPRCLFDIHGLQELYLSENEALTTLPDVTPGVWDVFTALMIKLDNNPSLREAMEDLDSITDCVTVTWNKIYPDHICGRLFLGSLRSAQSLKVYKDLSIKHILTCGRGLSVLIGPGMEQLELQVDDTPDSDMSKFFDEAHVFLEHATGTGEGVLVHCFAGLSRSATVLISYLMKTQHMRRDEALAFIRRSRPAVQPNEGFMKQLARYEKILFDSE